MKTKWFIIGSIIFWSIPSFAKDAEAPTERFWVISDAKYESFSEPELEASKNRWRELIGVMASRGQLQAVSLENGWYIKPRLSSLMIRPFLFKERRQYVAHLDVISLETAELTQRVVLKDPEHLGLFKKIRDWVLTENPVYDTSEYLLEHKNQHMLGILRAYKKQNLDKPFEQKIDRAVRDMITFIMKDQKMAVTFKDYMPDIGYVQRMCGMGRFKGKLDSGKLVMGRNVLTISAEIIQPHDKRYLKFLFIRSDTGEKKGELKFSVEKYLNPTTLAGTIYTILNVRR